MTANSGTTSGFDPLHYPICLSYPLRLVATAWAGHLPFAMLLVDLLRPRVVVELGIFSGVSYCAFCQAVRELGLDTRCYGVDTWQGDPQSGFFGPEVLEDLKQHHDPLYSGFSTLVQSTFDEAVNHFTDGAIDLLHIDGYHTYEVVKHDFENWLPKMSSRGVVLFHDINVRQNAFGVWKLWEEIRFRYPHFEFLHEHGLGLLAVGDSYPESFRQLLELSEADTILVREFFYLVGKRLRIQLDRDHEVATLSWQVKDKEKIADLLASQMAEKQQAADCLSTQLAETERVLLARDQAIAFLSQQIAEKSDTIALLNKANTSLREGLANSREDTRRATDLNESQRLQIDESGKLARALSSQLAERALAVQSLSERLTESQNIRESLLSELGKRTIELATRLAEKEQAVHYRSAQVEEREKTILARDEAITWLQAELAKSLEDNRRLTTSNGLLKTQLVSTQQSRRMLSAQLASRDAQLDRLVNSLGWRLLSRYGRIKYRYLLPVYRLLGLLRPAPAKTKPTGEQRGPIEEEGQTLELMDLVEFSQQVEGSVQDSQDQSDSYQSLILLPGLQEKQLTAILNQRQSTAPLHRADVICFSIVDWETRFQRPQQIMSQFASHGHRVFYISTYCFRPTEAGSRLKVSLIRENVYEVQLAAKHRPDVYGEVFEGETKAVMVDSLDELRCTFHVNEAISYVMIASWGSVALEARRLWGWRLMYDCMDEWENFPGIKSRLLDMESQLVRQCDLLVVTSQRLCAKWQEYDCPMELVRNAVDCKFYAEHYRPNTLLTETNHPIIGYYGAIADWFDIELLRDVAHNRPHYTFVLLGGIFDVDVSELQALPNVRLLGQQPYGTMPQYLYHFDACIIPFKINSITEATDPVKLYEYLSAGKPVVCTAMLELERFREYLYIAEDKEDFAIQLDLAVAENDREMVTRRRLLARQQTWTERYRQIEGALADLTPRATIVVVTYNNLALNRLCLESIIRNTEYPNYEVIVVDNNSNDGTQAYLRYMTAEHSNLQVVWNSKNEGFPRANNQGISRSTGDYIVLLNNDTVVPPGWLSRLLRHVQNPTVGMVGPVTNFVGNGAAIEVPYRTWGEMEAFAKKQNWGQDGKMADIHMLAMYCVAMRRETYELIGPLDEEFGIGLFEDDDYAQRVKAAGLRVICAGDVFVHHFGQAAFRELIETGEYNSLFDENRRRYETKWNVEWRPHKHAPLKFESLAGFAPALSDVPSDRTQAHRGDRTGKEKSVSALTTFPQAKQPLAPSESGESRVVQDQEHLINMSSTKEVGLACGEKELVSSILEPSRTLTTLEAKSNDHRGLFVSRVYSPLAPRPARKWNLNPARAPWYDQPNALDILEERRQKENLTDEEYDLLRLWATHGYCVVSEIIPTELIDVMLLDFEKVWTADQPFDGLQFFDLCLGPNGSLVTLSHAELLEIDLARRLKARDTSTWRINHFDACSDAAQTIFHNSELIRLTSIIFGCRSVPDSTLSFMYGSAQDAHQDTAVFHIFPPNYIVGAWIACEDISPDSGPLMFYPRSHLEPMFDKFVNYPQTNLRTADPKLFDAYKKYVKELTGKYERELFVAKKGEVLLWHGMLLHGGSEIKNPQLTRKSYVIHYMPPGMNVGNEIIGPFNW